MTPARLASGPASPLVDLATSTSPLARTGLVLSVHGDLTVQDLVFASLSLTILALGTAICWIAFQGYRRNQSRPMLFIALGFGLILLVEVVVAFLDLALDLDIFTLRTIIQATNVLGLLCILYALRMDA